MNRKIIVSTAFALVLALCVPNRTALASESRDYDDTSGQETVQQNNNYQFITERQQCIVVGVDEQGNLIYAGNTDTFADNYNRYTVVDLNREPVSQEDYIDEMDDLLSQQEAFEQLVADEDRIESDMEDIVKQRDAEEARERARYSGSAGTSDSAQEQLDIIEREQRPAVVIDINRFVSNGRFDFDTFEVNEDIELTEEEPVISNPRRSDVDNNVWFPLEDLQRQPQNIIEPQYAEYNIELEVGRIAHLFPSEATGSWATADKGIIGEAYRYEEPGFVVNYRANAKAPGTTTITHTHETNHIADFIETWKVNVYCRDLSFDEDVYVVQKSGRNPRYFTLNLKEFEYPVEFAYYFKWTSSNPEVATVADNWMSTYTDVCVHKAGVTTITVSDKYGNSRSTLLVVKPDEELLAEQAKAAVKTTAIKASAKAYSEYTKLTWTVNTDTVLDGYQIYYSTDGKKFKKLKAVKNPSTLYYRYRTGKSGRTYYYKVRGYKKIDGKTVYTPFSDVIKKKFK